jgi:DNA-binding protein HU-alpha
MFMRKPELASAIAQDTDLTKEKANEVITAFTEQVTRATAQGDDVALIGFGTFSVRKRDARTGHNPQTGAELKIPASKSVGFKAGKALKEAVSK